MLFRHGDVLIQRIEGAVSGRGKKLPHRVLALGEVTGHAHRVQESAGALLYRLGPDLLLEVTADAVTVVHEEHAPIRLERGAYRVWRQREYSPEEIRVIRD